MFEFCLKVLKSLVCDTLKLHKYEVSCTTYGMESDDDGFFINKKIKHCALCNDRIVKIEKLRDKALDHPMFLKLLKEYIELKEEGIEFPNYGVYIDNKESYSDSLKDRIEKFQFNYFDTCVRLYSYGTNISYKLLIESKKISDK